MKLEFLRIQAYIQNFPTYSKLISGFFLKELAGIGRIWV